MSLPSLNKVITYLLTYLLTYLKGLLMVLTCEQALCLEKNIARKGKGKGELLFAG